MADPIHRAVTLCDVLDEHVQRGPERLALTFDRAGREAEQFTRAQLEQRVRALAGALAMSAPAGARAVIACPNGSDFVIAFLACLRAGLIAVPIAPPTRQPSDVQRALRIVADAGASLFITIAEGSTMAADLLALLPENFARPTVVTTRAEPMSEQEAASLLDGRTHQELAFLQYTSGSTGDPKGVQVGHDNLMHNLAAMQRRFAYTEDTHGVHWLPAYHDMGLIGGTLLPLYVGFRTRLIAPLDFVQRPVRWLRALSEAGEATSPAPTFGYARCVSHVTEEEMQGLDLSRWRVAIVGAEPVRPEILDAFARKLEPVGFRRDAFYPCYGLAEATLMVSGGSVMRGARRFQLDKSALEAGRATPSKSPHASRELVGCGQAAPGDEVIIVNRDRREAEPGRIGEIWVKSPSVGRGYWNRDDASGAQPFACLQGHAGRFLRTGDLGVFVDGELIVTGRCRDLLIVAGKNHYPQDVEQTLEASCKDIAMGKGAVLQRDSGDLCAVYEVVASAMSTFDVRATTRVLQAAVSRDHRVTLSEICFVRPRTVPVTSSGKIRRHECGRMLARGDLDSKRLV